jgi:hypothetical protein
VSSATSEQPVVRHRDERPDRAEIEVDSPHLLPVAVTPMLKAIPGVALA